MLTTLATIRYSYCSQYNYLCGVSEIDNLIPLLRGGTLDQILFEKKATHFGFMGCSEGKPQS